MEPTKQTSKKAGSGVKIRSGLKGGRIAANHTHAGLKVAGGKAGSGVKIRSGLKGGRIAANHTRAGLKAAKG
jgi:hypothetical protein